MTIVLPFPPSILIPHARGHWAPKAKATKSYRKTCAEEALAQGIRGMAAEKIKALVTFHAPDRRRRDRANVEASFKAGTDGLADVIGVDDYHWRIEWQHGEPKPPRGEVIVELEGLA